MGKALLIVLAIAIPVFGLWWLIKCRGMTLSLGPAVTTTVPHPNPAAANPNAIESAIQKATGVPVGAIGAAASKSPLALKILLSPVAITSVAHNLITHPKAELKAIGKDVVSGTKSVLKAPVKLVTSPVKSVKAIGSGAKGAVKSVGSSAKKLGSAISHLF